MTEPLSTARALVAHDPCGSLISRVARRDRDALRALYDALAGQALAVGLRMLGSRSEAEEVLQDVFFDVWERSGSFDPERGSGRTWLLSIMRNRSLDRLRRRRVINRTLDEVRLDEPPPAPEIGGPHGELERRQERDRVRAALADLSDAQRQALHLAYFEGLSQSEIAERLHEPLGTVKSRIRAAMERLAHLLGSERSPT